MVLAALGPPLLIVTPAWGSRRVVGVALASALLALGRLLWYDPFYDVRCRAGCRPLAPLLGSEPALAEGLALAATAASLVAAALGMLALGRSVSRQVLLVVAAAPTGIRVADSPVLGAEQASAVAQVGLGVAGAVIGGALVLQVLRAMWERARVRELVDSIEAAEEPDELERRLRQLVGDESLRLALPTLDGFVLLDGNQAPASLAVLSHLTVDDEPVAVLLGSDPERGVPRLPARARLAVLTRVLERRLGVDIEELAEARTSMVVTAARARRALERDLHDGAQQEVLYAVSTLRAAERRGERLGDAQATATAAAARESVEAALLDVRRVANSVHPHALTASGLESALDSLATTNPVPMTLRVRLVQPLSPEVELCLYSAISDVVAASSCRVREVDVASAGATVTACIVGQGLTGETHLRDRIEALRGTLITQPTRIEVVLPCGR
jgi:signal transduction histidine kinase